MALATGNLLIREKMEVDIELAKLSMAHTAWQSEQYYMETAVVRELPQQIAYLNARAEALTMDVAAMSSQAYGFAGGEGFLMTIGDTVYSDRREAGAAIAEACGRVAAGTSEKIGMWGAHTLTLKSEQEIFTEEITHTLMLRAATELSVKVSREPTATIDRAVREVEGLPQKLAETTARLEAAQTRLERSQLELEKPFEHEAEMLRLTERARELETELKLDEHDIVIVGELNEGNSEHENAKEREATREPQRGSSAPYRGR